MNKRLRTPIVAAVASGLLLAPAGPAFAQDTDDYVEPLAYSIDAEYASVNVKPGQTRTFTMIVREEGSENRVEPSKSEITFGADLKGWELGIKGREVTVKVPADAHLGDYKQAKATFTYADGSTDDVTVTFRITDDPLFDDEEIERGDTNVSSSTTAAPTTSAKPVATSVVPTATAAPTTTATTSTTTPDEVDAEDSDKVLRAVLWFMGKGGDTKTASLLNNDKVNLEGVTFAYDESKVPDGWEVSIDAKGTITAKIAKDERWRKVELPVTATRADGTVEKLEILFTLTPSTDRGWLLSADRFKEMAITGEIGEYFDKGGEVTAAVRDLLIENNIINEDNQALDENGNVMTTLDELKAYKARRDAVVPDELKTGTGLSDQVKDEEAVAQTASSRVLANTGASVAGLAAMSLLALGGAAGIAARKRK